jgi:hypothetical protein
MQDEITPHHQKLGRVRRPEFRGLFRHASLSRISIAAHERL